jgi:hypothetical protein
MSVVVLFDVLANNGEGSGTAASGEVAWRPQRSTPELLTNGGINEDGCKAHIQGSHCRRVGPRDSTCCPIHFLRDGFAGTSMDAIAKSARVSVNTIYSHFANKQEFLAR